MNKKYLISIVAITLITTTFYACKGDTNSAPNDEGDKTSPTVTFITPSNGTDNVAVDTSIVVTFSEKISAFTVTADSFTVSNGTAVTGEITFAEENLVAIFTPTSNLSNGTQYTVSLTSGIMDTADNSLEPFTSNFSTLNQAFGLSKFGKDTF